MDFDRGTSDSRASFVPIARVDSALLSGAKPDSQIDIVREGLWQGFVDRAKSATEQPLMTALEIGGSFAAGALGTLALRSAGAWGVAAKIAMPLLGLGMVADVARRGTQIYNAYAETDGTTLAGQNTRRLAIANYAGSALFDYPLTTASFTLGVSSAQFFPKFSRSASIDAHSVAADQSAAITDRVSELAASSKSKVNLHFKVDADELVWDTLTNDIPNRWLRSDPDLIRFQKTAYLKDSAAYDFLKQYSFEDDIVRGRPLGNGSEISNRAVSLLKAMQNDASFKPVLAATENARTQVMEEWNANFPSTEARMTELLGRPISKDLTVYITHPSLRQGHASPGNDAIFWTNRRDFPNYNTVYLWHETLHHVIKPKWAGPEGNFDLGHATIELLADNQLRVDLNGGSLTPLKGHAYLTPGEEKLLPLWNQYVNQTGPRDINGFMAEASKFLSDLPAKSLPAEPRFIAHRLENSAAADPYGGSQPSDTYGGSQPSDPYGGSQPSDPYGGTLPNNPNDPYGGTAPNGGRS